MKQQESREEGDADAQEQATGGVPENLEQLAWLARNGSSDACYRLGTALMDRSHPEALLWLQSAAEQGHAKAAVILGFIYLSGVPAGVHHAKAFRWFSLAADLGDCTAQRRLGMMYERGLGCSRDLSKAIEWLAKAAAQGDIEAGFLARAVRERTFGTWGRSVLMRVQEALGLGLTPEGREPAGKSSLYS